EIFVNILEPFRSDGFYPHQRTLNVCPSHRVQKVCVLGRFHRYLSKEHHIVWQHRQFRHQLKSLLTNCFELTQAMIVLLARSQIEVCQCNRIEVVVSERNAAKTQSS